MNFMKHATARPGRAPQRLAVPAGLAADAARVLPKLLQTEMRAEDAFRVAHLLAVLSADPTVAAVNQTRAAMLRKHGKEEDGRVLLPPEALESFLAEFGPVAEKPVTFDLAPLPISVLQDLRLTPADALPLRPFFAQE